MPRPTSDPGGLRPRRPRPGAARPTTRLPTLRGTVAAIALVERATGAMRTVDQARALAHRGLDGDRYAAKAGTFTPADETARGYDLTLIEAEVLDSLTLPEGRTLGYADARRNVVTRGIDTRESASHLMTARLPDHGQRAHRRG